MSHPNARLTAHGRLLLCRRIERHGWRICVAAEAAGISRQTAGKWLARWRAEGAEGLVDRSSRPHRIRLRVVGAALRRVVRLRLTRRLGPARIAWHASLAPATVYRTLRRLRLHRLRALTPREPVVRYCWPHAGELVHLDTKKLGRIGPGGGKRFYRGSATATRASARTTPTWPSTMPRAAGLRRGARRRARETAAAFLGACPRLLRRPRRRGTAPAQPTTAAATSRWPSAGRRRSNRACGTAAHAALPPAPSPVPAAGRHGHRTVTRQRGSTVLVEPA